MQFKFVTALATLPLFTLAINYEAFSSTTCSAFGCTDNGGLCCGGIPAGFGYSVLFEDLLGRRQRQVLEWWGQGRVHKLVPLRAAGLVLGMSLLLRRTAVSFSYFKYTHYKGLKKHIKVPSGSNDAMQKIAD
ncbi:hypothetical protein K443DRAFT_123848 [Laccaria amethystina LaAM-08-1]|uniref:Hydrophobin n=1 Tax=Laccaria amethystina LaAM-08-1 TaxID=1095629 RepID=A0A0C9X9H5_9AGAR|nr:hypothetical protein K443DRAFT_123848 [Laccaria amethystina LaAM-08-1]